MLSHSYWPDSVGIAPYATETAEHLVREGHQVDVVTMPPYYPAWKVPAGVERGYSKQVRAGVTVWRIPTYVPAKPTLIRRVLFEASWVVASLPVLARLLLRRPDVVIGVHPGLFASALAALVGRKRLVQVVQDLVGRAADQSGMAGAKHVSRVLARIESWALRRADAVTVPTAAFSAALGELGVEPERVTVVPNWSRQHFDPAGARVSDTSDASGFVVLHAGNMGLKQGLEELGETMRVVAREMPDVRFRFAGAGSRAAELRSCTTELPNVELLGLVPDEEFPQLLRSADVLLVHERATVKDMCLPSKLTSYFAAGRPVLAVTAADSATAAEVTRSEAGLVLNPGDPEAFLVAIRKLRENPDLMTRLGEAGASFSSLSLRRQDSLGQLARLVG